MRKSQILISAWFRGNKVLSLPKHHITTPAAGVRGWGTVVGYVWLSLTMPTFPTAKEALWEDPVISTADPGFREGVEGKDGRGVPAHTWFLLGYPRCREKGLLGPLCNTGTLLLLWPGGVHPGDQGVGLGVFLPLALVTSYHFPVIISALHLLFSFLTLSFG